MSTVLDPQAPPPPMPVKGIELNGWENLFYYVAFVSAVAWWMIELTEYWFMAAILLAPVHNAILLLILCFQSVRSLVSRITHGTATGADGLLYDLDRLAYRVAASVVSLLKGAYAFCLRHAPARRR